MSRQSVYEGLKTAIQYNGLPYHHVEDDYCTITFESWDQFDPFDTLLDSLPVPTDLKICIYAMLVGDCSKGVAVTVSDDVQRLGYWDMYVDMKYKVAVYEDLLSRLFRLGCNPLEYSYEYFYVSLSLTDYARIEVPLANGDLLDKRPLVSNARDYKSIHLSFDC